jgi:hypothetical protein
MAGIIEIPGLVGVRVLEHVVIREARSFRMSVRPSFKNLRPAHFFNRIVKMRDVFYSILASQRTI